MFKSYSFLILAITLEVVGTMLLPISQNFTKVVPTFTLIVAYILSFYCLTFALQSIPIAIVYATWAGLGVFLIAFLGIIFFQQNISWQVVCGLFLIVIGVAIVNTFSSHDIQVRQKLSKQQSTSVVPPKLTMVSGLTTRAFVL